MNALVSGPVSLCFILCRLFILSNFLLFDIVLYQRVLDALFPSVLRGYLCNSWCIWLWENSGRPSPRQIEEYTRLTASIKAQIKLICSNNGCYEGHGNGE
nr:hypothetical protein Iba_chr12fCG7560 [Ipomoea batatas]